MIICYLLRICELFPINKNSNLHYELHLTHVETDFEYDVSLKLGVN